uniref:Protein FAM189A2 n=1 Tax=Cyclopterus lumpus TaxID=8103 RepID=A0A8C2YZH4_CYCLU
MVSASPGSNPRILPPPPPPQQPSPALPPWRRARIQRSNSDPTTDSSTQTSQPTLAACAQGQVTLRRGNSRPRPSSMVDYQSYRHTQQLVRRILQQPAAQGLAPEVQELVDSIRNVLQSDQEHMEEAVRCASYIEQVGVHTQTCQSTDTNVCWGV